MQRVRLAPWIIDLIEQYDLDEKACSCYCYMVKTHGNEGVNWLIEKNLITPENEQEFRIHFTFRDPEDGEYYLREEKLFDVEDITGDFAALITMLRNRGLRSIGHPNNPSAYAVIDMSQEAQEGYQRFKSQVLEEYIDLKRLADIVCHYYQYTEMPKKLGRYLGENAAIDYRSDSPDKHKIVR